MTNPPPPPWQGGQGQPPGGSGYGPPGPPFGPPPQPGPPWSPGPPPPPRRRGLVLLIALLSAGLVLVAMVIVAGLMIGRESGGGSDGGGTDVVALREGQVEGGAVARPGSDGSLTVARTGVEAPLVEVFEDFACPPCGSFDKLHGPLFRELASGGKAKVVYRPLVVFAAGREPMHGNSLRAASALRCLGDGTRWLPYKDMLYANQPADENTRGYETADLVTYAKRAGVTGDGFEKCVTGQQQSAAVLTASRAYLAAGLKGTPAVRLNGQYVDDTAMGDAAAMRQAIDNAG